LIFTIWLSTGMGLVLILGWLTMRYLLEKSFHHEPVPQGLRPEDFQLSSHEFFLTTKNAKKIQLYSIGEKNTGPLVLCIHGYENTVEKFFPLSQFLVTHNYRILLVNTRNHGGSDRDGSSTMIQFGEDLETAYNYSRENFGRETPIFLLGHSLGGATVLYKGVHFPDPAGIISIASFADLQKILGDGFLRKHFPRSMLPIVFRYIEWSIGYRIDDLSPLDNINKIRCPVLLLHGERDNLVPVAALSHLQEAAQSQFVKSKIIKSADHSSLLEDRVTFRSIHNFISSST